MPSTPESTPVASKPRISPDTWAVLLALALAFLIRIGLLKSVPW
jgi:hypothetical protein